MISEPKDSFNDDFFESIDEYVEWHKVLESRLLSDKKEIPRRQETKALLFTSKINIDHIYFMTRMFTIKQTKKLLPLYIFSYLANYTNARFKTLSSISEKKFKSEASVFLQSQVFTPKTPRYLKMTKSTAKGMNKLCSEDLLQKIKYSFIHIVSFLKILNLPICNESDKIKCMKWYYENFEDNANLFFLYHEIKWDKDDKFVLNNSVLNQIIESIVTIDDTDSSDDYIARIKMYINEIKNDKKANIEERDPDFFLVPDSFSKRFDYFCGKYLFRLLFSTKNQYDLFSQIIDTTSVSADELSVESGEDVLFSLSNVDFSFSSIIEMTNIRKTKRLYAPFPFFILNYECCNEPDTVYQIDGCITKINGEFMLGNKTVECGISEIDCQDEYDIFIKGFKHKTLKLPDGIDMHNFLSNNWVGHILVYYILYKGMQDIKFEHYLIEDDSKHRVNLDNTFSSSLSDSDVEYLG